MGHNDNSKSTTYSVRVPLWLDEELQKKRVGDESTGELVRRALVAFIAGGSDDNG